MRQKKKHLRIVVPENKNTLQKQTLRCSQLRLELFSVWRLYCEA